MTTTPSSQSSELVILKDAEGALYAVPRAVIGRGRIAADRAADLEQVISGDTRGYITPGTDALPTLSVFGSLNLQGLNPEMLNTNAGVAAALDAQAAFTAGLESGPTGGIPS